MDEHAEDEEENFRQGIDLEALLTRAMRNLHTAAPEPAAEQVAESLPAEPAPAETFEDELPVTEVLRPKTAPVEDIPAEEAPAEEVPEEEPKEEPEVEEPAAEVQASEEALPVEEEILEKAKAPVWTRPENIPSLRARKLEEEAAAAEAEPAPAPEIEDPLAKRAAVNIEKIEEGLETVEFEPVELPEPELEASGGEAEERKEILQDLEKEVKRDDPFKPFQALKLEDLFGDDYVPLREKDPKEATRFTQSLNLDWTKHNGL